MKVTENFIEANNKFEFYGDSQQSFVIQTNTSYETKFKPNAVVDIEKRKSKDSLTFSGDVVYKVRYSFNEKGIRSTPIPDSFLKHAIFFGDNQTFGESVNDNETLPFYYQQFNSGYKSHNYGAPKYGPRHALGWLKDKEFINEFKNTTGKVFYIYRDEAIANLNKFDRYISPAKYSLNDYMNVVNVFKDMQKQIYSISNKLKFIVVILPLSFTWKQMSKLLNKKGIDVSNLYFVDLEYLTNIKSRTIDGGHTKHTNEILGRLVNSSYINKDIYPDSQFDSYESLKSELKLRSFFMPSFIHWPKDDAGVIVENLLKRYKGSFDLNELLKISEKSFYEKVDILQSNGYPDNYSSEYKLLFDKLYLEWKK